MSNYNPVCSNCDAKSGNCAYGDPRGSESCVDAIKELRKWQKKQMEKDN